MIERLVTMSTTMSSELRRKMGTKTGRATQVDLHEGKQNNTSQLRGSLY